jgi:hypothetical protein
MTRETRTMKTVKAAFSKSVGCTSIERNSVLHPMCSLPPRCSDEGGGGFQRTVCQLVDWMFSKCSVASSSLSSTRSCGREGQG